MVPPSDFEITEWLVRSLSLQSRHAVKIVSSKQNPSSVTWVVEFFDAVASTLIFIKHQKEECMYEREKHVLVRLRQYSDENERYAVPQILAWDNKLRVVALKWLKGEPVGRKLRAAVARTGSEDELTQGLKLAYEVGRWLYCFERHLPTGKLGAFPAENTMQRIHELTLLIRSKGLRGFDESFSKILENYVAHHLGLINGHCEFFYLHRDFWFGHIWEKNNGIVVIDFGRCIEGPRGRDATQFYSRLGDFSILNPLVSPRKVSLLQAEFVRGYGKFDLHAPSIAVYMILLRLELLGGIIERAYSNLLSIGVAKWHARAHFHRLEKTLHFD